MKNLTKTHNYPPLCYFAIGNHQYFTKDVKKCKSLIEIAKFPDENGVQVISF